MFDVILQKGNNRTGGEIVNLSAATPVHKIQVKIHPIRVPFCGLDVDDVRCECELFGR